MKSIIKIILAGVFLSGMLGFFSCGDAGFPGDENIQQFRKEIIKEDNPKVTEKDFSEKGTIFYNNSNNYASYRFLCEENTFYAIYSDSETYIYWDTNEPNSETQARKYIKIDQKGKLIKSKGEGYIYLTDFNELKNYSILVLKTSGKDNYNYKVSDNFVNLESYSK